MRQLPAIDSRSWKQKRGSSAPAASQACSSVYSGGTSISLPSTMSLVISSVPCRPPSGAARRPPQLCSGSVLPAERMLARPMQLEMFKPFDRFPNAGPMACRHPPHHQVRAVELLEPFLTAAIETLVHRLPDVALERLDAVPHRHVQQQARVVERMDARRGAACLLQPPDEAGAALG